jgi:Xaa-Pro aminopeptidase
MPQAKIEDCMDLLWSLIEEKSPYDTKMIKRTAKIADMTMETALNQCREGRPEYEIGIAAQKVAAANGAEVGTGTTVRTHLYIASGSETLANLRPYSYTAKKLKRGEMFIIDLSVHYNGYYTDFCRTVCVGKPSKEQRGLFDVVEETHYTLFDSLKPGTTGAELWEIAYNIAKRYGREDRMNIWMGHGTGIVISEPPFLYKSDKRPLRKGTFVNIEPGIFLPETIGSASLEDATFIGAKGASWVTKCERGLHIA